VQLESLKPVDTRVESAWLPRLTLNCDELLTKFAFKCNLRRYNKVTAAISNSVGQCMLNR